MVVIDGVGEQGFEVVNGDKAHIFEGQMKSWRNRELFGSLTITTCWHRPFLKVYGNQPINMNVNKIMWCIIYHNHMCDFEYFNLMH